MNFAMLLPSIINQLFSRHVQLNLFMFSELLPRGSMGPDMVVGGEPWHRGLPSDWVPIIARDIQRQAEEGQQVTFANYYSMYVFYKTNNY